MKFAGEEKMTNYILQVRTEINAEYEIVKDLTKVLQSFKSDSSRSAYSQQDYGSRFEDYSRHEEPTRDPDVWPPPTPVENRLVNQIKLTYLETALFVCF